MLHKLLLLSSILVALIGCGGGGSSTSNNSANAALQPTPGQAQGVYSGTSSNGFSFDSIVLPNDKFYAIYGNVSGNLFLITGFVFGQGTSNNGTYTASVTDIISPGTTISGTLKASYTPGTSISGTLTENGTNITFRGSPTSTSSYKYNQAAVISEIVGTWNGDVLDGSSVSVTINSDGTFSGSDSSGCAFTGTGSADGSGKNFFDLSVNFGGSPCVLANQSASGIAVDYLLSDGVTRQLLAGVTSGSFGTVFAADK